MKNRVAPTLIALAVLVCWTATIGCNTRKPLQLDEGLATAGLDRIVLLPIIDARPDRFEYVTVGRDVATATFRTVAQKGYRIVPADAFAQRPEAPFDIETVTAAALMNLAPEDAHTFLVVQIEKLARTIDEAGVIFTVRVSGLLVDRDLRRVLWRDVATASNNLTGVLTLLSHGSSQYEAAVNATRSLFQTLPARGELSGKSGDRR